MSNDIKRLNVNIPVDIFIKFKTMLIARGMSITDWVVDNIESDIQAWKERPKKFKDLPKDVQEEIRKEVTPIPENQKSDRTKCTFKECGEYLIEGKCLSHPLWRQ